MVIVGQVPQQSFMLDRYLQKMAFSTNLQSPLSAVRATSTTVVAMDALSHNAANIIALEQRRGVPMLDLSPMFRAGKRLMWGDEKASWYVDHSHLSLIGSLRLRV